MDVIYGKGSYKEGTVHISGDIILSDHKLYLKGEKGDYARTYVPLEKIEKIHARYSKLNFFVRPSLAHRYQAEIHASSNVLKRLLEDIVKRRGLRKTFLKREWVEDTY